MIKANALPGYDDRGLRVGYRLVPRPADSVVIFLRVGHDPRPRLVVGGSSHGCSTSRKLPSGRWRGIATIAGTRRSQTFDTEGEALHWADVEMRRAAAAEREAEGTSRTPGAPELLTLAKFAAIYLDTRVLGSATLITYRSNLQPGAPTLGQLAAGRRDVRGRQRVARRTWPGHAGEGWPAPRTLAAALKQLRAVYGEAVRMERVEADPTQGIRIPTVPETPIPGPGCGRGAPSGCGAGLRSASPDSPRSGTAGSDGARYSACGATVSSQTPFRSAVCRCWRPVCDHVWVRGCRGSLRMTSWPPWWSSRPQ